MSFSHTLLEELQLPSGIATLGEERNRLWRYEHHQAIFVQRWERRCKVLFAANLKRAKRSYCPAQPLHARAKALAAANRWPVPTLDVAFCSGALISTRNLGRQAPHTANAGTRSRAPNCWLARTPFTRWKYWSATLPPVSLLPVP
jgi:hypothetical protein